MTLGFHKLRYPNSWMVYNISWNILSMDFWGYPNLSKPPYMNGYDGCIHGNRCKGACRHLERVSNCKDRSCYVGNAWHVDFAFAKVRYYESLVPQKFGLALVQFTVWRCTPDIPFIGSSRALQRPRHSHGCYGPEAHTAGTCRWYCLTLLSEVSRSSKCSSPASKSQALR